MNNAPNPSGRSSLSIPWLAIGALVLVNALWGISFPIVKSLNGMSDAHFGVPIGHESGLFRLCASGWMLATRFTLAFALLVLFATRMVYYTTRREWIAGSVIGVLFFVGMILQVIGLATIPASRSGFLTSLTTVFTPLFGAILFRVFPTRWMVAGAILALTGVMVLTGLIHIDSAGVRLAKDASERWTVGDSLTTIASMFFAFQVLLLDYYGKRMRSVALTCGMFSTTAVLCWLLILGILCTPLNAMAGVGAMSALDWVNVTCEPAYWISLLILASLCSVISFGLMNRFQPHVTASQAAVIYSLEPVFASSWALFLPGWLSMMTTVSHANEELTWSLIIGGVMILAANVVALYPVQRPKATSGDSRTTD